MTLSSFFIEELLDKATKGYDVAKVWLKKSFDIEAVENAPLTVWIDFSDFQGLVDEIIPHVIE